ncbi:MAG: hypothetical protein QF473_29685 [Planctomycetota bacterium]|jgi:hypothetical protein|nr:hypothetical protein [Planctomycetota bacterium]
MSSQNRSIVAVVVLLFGALVLSISVRDAHGAEPDLPPHARKIREAVERWRESWIKSAPGAKKQIEKDPLTWYIDRFTQFWCKSVSLEEFVLALWDKMGKPKPADLEKQAARLLRAAKRKESMPRDPLDLPGDDPWREKWVAARLRALAKDLRKPPGKQVVTGRGWHRAYLEKRAKDALQAAKDAYKELAAARRELSEATKAGDKIPNDAPYGLRHAKKDFARAKAALDKLGDKKSYDWFKRAEKTLKKWQKKLAEEKQQYADAAKRLEKAKQRLKRAQDNSKKADEEARRAGTLRKANRRSDAVDGLKGRVGSGKGTAAPKPNEKIKIKLEYMKVDPDVEEDTSEIPTGKPVSDSNGFVIGWVTTDKKTGRSWFEPASYPGTTPPTPQPVTVGPDGTVTLSGKPIGRIATKRKRTNTAPKKPTWPNSNGVLFTFIPSGSNYGDIGDLLITNTTESPVTTTVPPGLLFDSSEPAVQDLYVADVPTRTPQAGAAKIGKSVSVDPGQTLVINDIPGFCPDFELAPPKPGAGGTYAVRPPDKKAKPLLAALERVRKFDIGKLKLDVFKADQTRRMLAQGALWMVDSRADDVKGNEVTGQKLTDRFWTKFEQSAAESLKKMPPKQRDAAKKLVKNDIKEIVKGISFVSK